MFSANVIFVLIGLVNSVKIDRGGRIDGHTSGQIRIPFFSFGRGVLYPKNNIFGVIFLCLKIAHAFFIFPQKCFTFHDAGGNVYEI